MEMMSPSLQNDLRRGGVSKPCTVSGCGGTMTFRHDPEVASASDGSTGATWVCENDPSHVEVVTAADDIEISGR